MGEATARDFGPRPELTWLPVDRLDVDASYQRSLETPASRRLIERIAENFRWASFQAILATPQGADRWLIIDGQHRVAGAKQAGLALVPAVVIQQASAAEQAAAFVGANRDRVAMSAQALYHARVLAGDAEAQTVARLCEAAGIKVLRWNLSAARFPAGKTCAVSALFYLVKTYGEEVAGAAIRLVAERFGREPGTLRAPFFRAAGQFLYDNGNYNLASGEATLRLALLRVGWRGLEKAGEGLGGSTAIAAMVAQLRATLDDGPGARSAPEASARVALTAAKPAAARPARAAKSAPPARDDDAAAIARFIAEKGIRHVMAPEQVAEFLREAGHDVLIVERSDGPAQGKWQSNSVRRPVIDGKECSMAKLYELANELRGVAGLPVLAIPAEANGDMSGTR